MNRTETPRTRTLVTLLTCAVAILVTTATLSHAQEKRLKVLTINVWSGLDYRGFWSFGEHESDERRKQRYDVLLHQIKALNPDIVFAQELNPVGAFACRLASDLGYDEIHQVCNAGIKVASLGIPWNFKEGIAILLKKEFKMREADVWKLSGGFGLYGDILSLHFDQSIFAQVATVVVDSVPLLLVNVHLSSAAPTDTEGAVRRLRESEELVRHLQQLPKDIPVVLAGDFNATPDSKEIALITSAGYIDSFDTTTTVRRYTWDAFTNENISYSVIGVSHEAYDSVSRRIDYVFLGNGFGSHDITSSEIALDSTIHGIHASDHFGVSAEISLSNVAAQTPKERETITGLTTSTLEPLPIVTYDTDAGFGYGAKAFFLNQLGLNESFDVVLFNSTKGERWYRFVFSMPDVELRQGKTYPVAFDLLVDYDKWIHNSFFGVGEESRFQDREFYTREPFEVCLSASRGLTRYFVTQLGVRHKSVRNYNFSDTSRLARLLPSANFGTATFSSVFAAVRYDTRNSYINPSRGLVFQVEGEYAPPCSFTNASFSRLSASVQNYRILIYPTTVLATRCSLQGLIGTDLPVQTLLSVGGNLNLRGSPQDRYLGKVAAVANAELRFPLYGPLGGIAGFDCGRVASSISNLNLRRWAMNSTVGLRLYLKTFVVRLDVGLGSETTGFYFNFGQVF